MLKRAATFVSDVLVSMTAVVASVTGSGSCRGLTIADLELFSKKASAGFHPVGVQQTPLARDKTLSSE